VLEGYLRQRTIPDATFRNWNSYSNKVQFEKARPDDPVGRGVNVMEAFNVLPDPQTNGGLLIAVAEESVNEVKELLVRNGLNISEPIGRMINKQEKTVFVK
jgi:selenide,water dikinase